MKALVTGAGGFLGRALCKALLAGDWEVVGVGQREAPLILADLRGLTWIVKDLSCEILSPGDVEGVDILFHLAAVLKAQGPSPDLEFLKANRVASFNVFQACAPSVSRMIYASTQMVYGDPNSLSVDESYPIDAEMTCYGLSKWHGENWLKYFHLRRRWGSAFILRFPGFIESEDSIFSYLITSAKANRPIELFSMGEVCRDYLSVPDALQAFFAAATVSEKKTSHRQASALVYNIGSGNCVRMLDLARAVCDLLGSSSAIVPVSTAAPRSNFVFNINKARSELSFVPTALLSALTTFVKNMFLPCHLPLIILGIFR